MRFTKQKSGAGALEAHHERTKDKYARNPNTDIAKKTREIELPQSIINEFARFLVPEIRKFYDSEQGQLALAEWQTRQEREKQSGK